MPCPFCDQGNLSDLVLLKNPSALIILNRYPPTKGSLLVIPANHVRSISELSEVAAMEFFRLVYLAIQDIKDKLKPEGLNVVVNEGVVAGQTVEHVHAQVLPRYTNDDLQNFTRKSPKGTTSLSTEEIQALRVIFNT